MPKRGAAKPAPGDDTPAPTASKRPQRSCAVPKEPEKPVFDLCWTHEADYFHYMTSPLVKPSAKLAGFDLDWTIVKPRQGQFAKSRHDWEWMFDGAVVAKLQELNKQGFKIIFITNQAGVEKNKTQVEDVQWKINDLCKELGFPIQACICGAEDHWRKPSPAMWEFITQKHNGNVPIDRVNSFFCGDAAGRPKDWKPKAKKDFSCSDRAFAFNIGLPFLEPEQCFLGQLACPKFEWDSIDPQKYADEKKGQVDFEGSLPVARPKDMIIMIGLPASGKSHFGKKYLASQGYEWVNRDTLGTQDKCMAAAQAAMKAGKSVVIDNTNPDPAARASYIEAAKKNGYSVRAFEWDTPREVCEHLNWVRVKHTSGAVRRIPDVAYNVCAKKLTSPSLSEGFSELCKCHFVPCLDDPKVRKLFLERT